MLGSDKVFIDGKIRLIDPSAIAQDPFSLTPHRLYSPEVIRQLPDIDILKSDVFALALLILEAALLVPLSNESMPEYDLTKINLYLT